MKADCDDNTIESTLSQCNDSHKEKAAQIKDKNKTSKPKKDLIKCSICELKVKDWNYNSHMKVHSSQILPWLYLGSYGNAQTITELTTLNITYILNCAEECENVFEDFEYKYLKMNIKDEDFPLKDYFSQAHDFINQALTEKKNILVHCFAGASRSAAIVISYLMFQYKYSYDQAYSYVKERRQAVNVNKFFIKQLKEFI